MASVAAIGRAQVVERVTEVRDGVRLAVRDQGRADAEHTVVLLHGLCLTQESWSGPARLLRRSLGDRVRVISYDHRGHGRSDRADLATYHVEQLADDLSDVLESLRVAGPVTLAGHSLGGMTAVTYCARSAERRPVDPQGLVVVASAAGQLGRLGLGRLLASPAPAVLAALVARAPAAAVEHTLRTLVRPACELAARCRRCGAAEREVLCRMCTAAMASTMLMTAAGYLPHLRKFDQTHALSGIDARTIVLSGGNDIVTPVAHARHLAAGIPGAAHRHYPSAGHMMLHDVPDKVADAIAATLTKRPVAQPAAVIA
jgi:pimeloyl-ACP methyl ester carboxylesterase